MKSPPPSFRRRYPSPCSPGSRRGGLDPARRLSPPAVAVSCGICSWFIPHRRSTWQKKEMIQLLRESTFISSYLAKSFLRKFYYRPWIKWSTANGNLIDFSYLLTCNKEIRKSKIVRNLDQVREMRFRGRWQNAPHFSFWETFPHSKHFCQLWDKLLPKLWGSAGFACIKTLLMGGYQEVAGLLLLFKRKRWSMTSSEGVRDSQRKAKSFRVQ